MLVKLILENYIPLLSSGIKKITLDTTEKVNLFISKNGSGKSSVLKELNPLPPENGNYKDGRKFVELFYNNKTYILDSHTHVGNGHSFKVVDEDGSVKELNPNGTFTSQKDLVEQHFGLDGKLVKVLNGVKIADRLSVMSATARKDLLMQVYPNDTNYALNVFNKLRVERNELKAAIKNQLSRYAEESRKLKEIDEVGLDELERRIKGMEHELKECLLLRGGLGNLETDPFLTQKIRQFDLLVSQLAVDKLTGFYFTKPELEAKIEQELLLEQHHRDSARDITTIINENKSGLDGLEEFLKDPELFKEQVEQVEQDYALTNERIAQLDGFLSKHKILTQDPELLKDLDKVCLTLSEYLGRVTCASSTELTGAIYKGYMERFEQLGSEIRDLKNKEVDFLHKLKHYEKADVIECPDCSSKFKVGVTKDDIDNVRQMANIAREKIDRLEQEREVLNKKIENDADWYLTMNQLFSFVRENSHVKVLPELLKEFNIGKTLSNTLQNALQAYLERFKLTEHIKALEDERKVIKARLSVYDRNNLLDVSIYLKSLEENLVEENTKINACKERIEKLRESLKVITHYNTKLIELDKLKEDLFTGLEEDVKYKLKRILDAQISKVTAEKEMCLASIIKSRSLSSVVESINDDITRLKQRLKAVEILIGGLCPNKGLIGKMMTDFIETICGNMNAVIKEIWETPLYIKPCNKDNGELTYKFPVVTGDEEPTPDVSDCSGGESDIIDWVFRFVLLSYIRYPFPLIMDEVGPFLDEIKRGRFFNFVKEYTEQKDARQLFLVSHYFVQYAIFKDANTIGLKYDGLTLPNTINQMTTVE